MIFASFSASTIAACFLQYFCTQHFCLGAKSAMDNASTHTTVESMFCFLAYVEDIPDILLHYYIV